MKRAVWTWIVLAALTFLFSGCAPERAVIRQTRVSEWDCQKADVLMDWEWAGVPGAFGLYMEGDTLRVCVSVAGGEPVCECHPIPPPREPSP